MTDGPTQDATDGATAANAHEIDPETLPRLPDFYDPTVSPDGRKLAYFHDGSGRMELYTRSLDDGERTQWSDGNVPRNLSGGVMWDHDGNRLFFHRDDDGDEQNDVHAIYSDGRTEPVVETEGQAFLAGVGPEGTLLYAADEAGQLNLHRYDPETDDSERVTAHDRPVWANWTALSPDGRRAGYATNASDDPENRDVYVVDLDGGDPRRLDVGEVGARAAVGDWFPDGRRLLVGDDTPDLPRVGVYDLDEDAVTWLGDGSAVERPAAVGPDGRMVVALRTRAAATVPVAYDLETGESRELDVPEGVARPARGRDSGFVDDGRLLFVNRTATRRPHVVSYDLATDESSTVMSADYGDLDRAAFVEPEYVTYESGDGLEIGALLYEVGDAPGPAVVKVHGGPTGQSQRAFDPRTQFLATQGYTVLEPNYRGSTGRGREFRNRIREDWGGMEQVDVRRGAEWLADRDAVDPDRIAVFGLSYGGYSTYCQLTMHPEPWAAGVAWVGMTDLLALYDESMPHFESLLEDMLGDPEENEALYRERSPVTHVDDQEAPVLVLHGVNDPRCPISQARTYRDALSSRGWEEGEDGDFEYEELGEEGHASTDVEQRVRVLELLGDFLDRRL